jgi:hypothetical protein
MHGILADMLLVFHAAYIAFVVAGFILTAIGMFRQWKWIRNVPFRVLHLGAIGIVVAEAWLGVICPLTAWESELREAAGGTGYSEPFVAHWLQRLIYYDFPPWVFTLAYTVFGAMVALTWILAPPRRRRAEDA